MSCKECEDNPMETYVKVGDGTITVIGCEKHLKELIRLLRLGLVRDKWDIVQEKLDGGQLKSAKDVFTGEVLYGK